MADILAIIWEENERLNIYPVPFITIPTTAGIGSEVTSVTVIANTKDDIKMMIKDPAFIPEVAIVDPILTYSTPPSVTAATGIDALCHALEAYISHVSQPMTDHLALSAIELIMKNLRAAYIDGQNTEAREKMAHASMQAGLAFTNASVPCPWNVTSNWSIVPCRTWYFKCDAAPSCT